MTEKELIIVGAGAAGLTAAIYARRYGIDTLVLEKLFPGGMAATADKVENIPGVVQPVRGMEWMMQLTEQARKFGPEMRDCVEVTGLTQSGKKWILHTTEEDFLTKTLIIATGCGHRKLGVVGEDRFHGRGVSYCATCDGMFFRNKTVAVIGGGNTALQGALVLANIVQKMYIVHRRDEFRGEIAYLNDLKAFGNIEFCLSATLEEIEGSNKVEKIRIKSVKDGALREISVDGVFVFVGFSPYTDPFRNIVDCDETGFIRVDQSKKTNLPGIYAAGDVTVTPLRQIVTSCADGAIAAFEAYQYLKKAD